MLKELLEELLESGSQASPRQGLVRSLLAEYQRLSGEVEAAERRLAEQKKRLEALREALRKAGAAPPAAAPRITPEAVVRIIEAPLARPAGAGAAARAPGTPPPAKAAATPRPAQAAAPAVAVAPGAPQAGAAEVSEDAMGFDAAGQALRAPVAAAKPAPAGAAAPAEEHPAEEPLAEEALVEGPAEAAVAATPAPADDLDAAERQLVAALDTGRQALAELDRCVALAQELARAGAWRVVKGLVSPRSPEHARIDEARRAAGRAQALLKSFDRQVRALRGRFGERIEAAEVADLAGDFARALVDPAREGPPGRLAADAARAAYHDVRRLCARLQLEAIAVRARRAAAVRRGRLGPRR
ncbi:MAG: hypothetical protein FJ288_06035 [Planctomycetes bacterium]|nr:hypothetical protein [Planctomycetota bacterium]